MSEKIVNTLTDQFLNYLKDNDITEPNEISSLTRNIFDQITSKVLEDQNIEKQHISSPNAVVEVKDQNGQLYRRYLELEYEETSNGIRLKGESLGGEPSEIVFLSNQSIARIAELRGEGSDDPEHH